MLHHESNVSQSGIPTLSKTLSKLIMITKMKNVVIGLLVLAYGGCVQKQIGDRKESPNVVFIYADDLGRGLLSSEGQKIIQTPNIDKLSAQGVRFENAYGSMFCAPARASLLTGYHDCQTDKWKIARGGAYIALSKDSTLENLTIQKALDEQYGEIPENEVFMAEVFQQAGYVTGQFGKLDWGFSTTHNQLKRHGWDEYYGYYDHVRCHGFYPPFLFENTAGIWKEGNTIRKTLFWKSFCLLSVRTRRKSFSSTTPPSCHMVLQSFLKFIQTLSITPNLQK